MQMSFTLRRMAYSFEWHTLLLSVWGLQWHRVFVCFIFFFLSVIYLIRLLEGSRIMGIGFGEKIKKQIELGLV